MTAIQVAEAMLELEGAPRLVDLFRSGRRCDAVPVQTVMLRMFPDTAFEDLAEGLQLALTLARLDMAEFDASGGVWPTP